MWVKTRLMVSFSEIQLAATRLAVDAGIGRKQSRPSRTPQAGMPRSTWVCDPTNGGGVLVSL